MGFRIGVDIGGTFTDAVVIGPDGDIATGKSSSTPEDLSAGFFAALSNAATTVGLSLSELLEQADLVVHATTTGTNAVVQRSGAKVGLLTTKGHGDCLRVMRGGGRTKGLEIDDLLYVPGTYKPEPIVSRDLICEVTERIDVNGEVIVALAEDEVQRGIATLLARGAETIAIGFLWSFVNPAHEQRARELVHDLAPDTFVSCSYEAAPRLGEYSRLVATVMNAYLGDLMAAYSDRISRRAMELGHRREVLFAQSIGGAVPVAEVKKKPLFTFDSGPVCGVIASAFLGSTFGYHNVITADMGGTTLDVAVISDGNLPRRESTIINQYEAYLPMLDVASIGAGGGSVAWVDPASRTLKVGPRSAGSDPGPLCYLKGATEPTVTDADVALGILNPDYFLAGRRKLDAQASRDGIARLGEQVGLSMEEAAAGIIDIVDNAMAEKIRLMTVARGHDPRDFVVFAFGGAGPSHAGAFARELGVDRVIIPLGDTSAVLSALGTLSSDVVHIHDSSTRMTAPFDTDELAGRFAELEKLAMADLEREGFVGPRAMIRFAVAMKYGAQVHDIEVAFNRGESSASLVQRFERSYAARFGAESGYAPAGVELIGQRVYAIGVLERPEIRVRNSPVNRGQRSPRVSERAIWSASSRRWMDTPVIRDITLADPGFTVAGPAVVELPDTTVKVANGERLQVDNWGNLVLTFEQRSDPVCPPP